MRTLLFVALAVSAQAAPPAKSTPRKLAADTPFVAPGGTRFTVPAGWSVVREDILVFDIVESDSHLAVIDGAKGDAEGAVAAAWAAYHKQPKLKVITPRAGRNGWDESRVFDYETSPNERAAVQAVALRRGAAWTVVLLDAKEPTLEKRIAGVMLVNDTLMPKDYQRESFRGKKPHPLDAARIQVLKDFIAAGMKELDVPGVGLALIDGGKIVYEGGLGVRELGKPDLVDANTLFIAASNTKALTTLLLAKLVDDGKLAWDMPVTRAYPGFKLGSADTTQKVLLKHLVCACTGLPRQDLEWLFEYKDATPLSEVKLLGTMQPTTNFGETFQYSNLLASMGGFVAAHILHPEVELGAAYDRSMRELVFAPLEMNATTFDFAVAMRGNYARPHSFDFDAHVSQARMDLNYSVLPLRPAGGAWTSAHDLARYLMMELARGTVGGKRYISEKNLLLRRDKQVTIGDRDIYGMGLETDTTWDVPVVHHGGSLIGYKSDMMFLPDHGVGAVILTNSDTGWILERPFMRRLLEVLFDGKPEAAEDLHGVAAQQKARLKAERALVTIPPDAALTQKLAARYRNPALGLLTVAKKDGAVSFDAGEWWSRIASRKNDDGTVSFITMDPGYGGYELVAGAKDGKRTLTIRDAQHEYVFTEEN